MNFNWFYKILDAVMTAALRPNQSSTSLIQTILNLRTSHYDRFGAMTNLINRLWPGFGAWATRRLMCAKYLPIPGARIQMLAYSTGSTVFMLESRDQPDVCMVLKVYRRSLGQPPAMTFEMVSQYQAKHAQLVEWFNDPYEIVVPSYFLVLRGPLLGATCMAVLQEYVPGKKYDLFIDFSIEQIVQRAAVDERLRVQLLDFASRQLRFFEETGSCFDMLGRDNLMLVETEGKLDLKIVDNNYFDFETLKRLYPSRLQRLRGRLDHLNRIRLALLKDESSLSSSNNLQAVVL